MLSDSDIRERLGPLEPPSTPDPTPRSRSASLIAFLAVLVVLLWGAGIGLVVHLERISPHVYDSRSGHIYRFTDTLHTVYLTPKERYIAWSAVGLPLLGTLALVLFVLPRRPAEE